MEKIICLSDLSSPIGMAVEFVLRLNVVIMFRQEWKYRFTLVMVGSLLAGCFAFASLS